jgi:hypothetical protein
MPNSCHVPVCPFYVDEKRKSISCEDTFRGFKTTELKYSWMEIYCDSWEWQKCPYARDLAEAYARFEEGDITALEEHKIEAMKKEMKSLSTKLGRAEKRIARQQKRIDELRAVNQSYQRRNDDLYKKWRSADSRVRAQDDKIWEEIGSLSAIYEQRMAYLIDTYCPDKKLRERDVKAWAGDREFAIVAVPDKEDETMWGVAFKENEDDGKRSEDIPDNSEEPAQ